MQRSLPIVSLAVRVLLAPTAVPEARVAVFFMN
ncbi:hypothetical protein NOR53_2746 [gamma proteobacterium NOR5-3]|nr:hypothetical protein NOR53_2746 [gamma proteobacterium NOR5-3]